MSELALTGSVLTTDILAVDVDQPGPFSTVQYNIKPGPFSDVIMFDNQLQGKLTLVKALDYEKRRQIKLRIVAQDQGLPPRSNETSLTINVMDADDQNPVFLHAQYKAVLLYIITENNTTVSDGELPVRMGLKVEVNSHGIKLRRSLRTNVINQGC